MILYSIEKPTRLFTVLSALHQRMQVCEESACKLAKEIILSYENRPVTRKSCYIPPTMFLAGGIDAVFFPTVVPEGWKEYDKFSKLYYPLIKPENSTTIEQIGALPKLNYLELKEIIQYKSSVRLNPLFGFSEELVIIGVPKSAGYIPDDEMEMIAEKDHTYYFQRLGRNDKTNIDKYYL